VWSANVPWKYEQFIESAHNMFRHIFDFMHISGCGRPDCLSPESAWPRLLRLLYERSRSSSGNAPAILRSSLSR
jgi:hypothetical protein